MEITFYCPNCKAKLKAEVAPGVKLNCPKCTTPIVVPRVSLPAGTMIGGFRLERLLGRGGMGDVYLARQLSLNREVALKLLTPHVTHD